MARSSVSFDGMAFIVGMGLFAAYHFLSDDAYHLAGKFINFDNDPRLKQALEDYQAFKNDLTKNPEDLAAGTAQAKSAFSTLGLGTLSEEEIEKIMSVDKQQVGISQLVASLSLAGASSFIQQRAIRGAFAAGAGIALGMSVTTMIPTVS